MAEDSQQDTTREGESETEPTPRSSFAAALGFQSLSGLFNRPTSRGRYSRRHNRYVESTPSERISNSQLAEKPAGSHEATIDGGFFRPLSRKPNHQSASASSINTSTSVGGNAFAIRKLNITNSNNSPRGRIHRTRRQRSGSRLHITKDEQRIPNPFGRSGSRNSTPQSGTDQPAGEPWGVRRMESLVAPADQEHFERATQTELDKDEGSVLPKTDSSTSVKSTSHLTHLTSSGEAHMVDVGAKPATRRVAIAAAIVRFGNARPFQLIFENQNKKGDVLAVARVAGIMASKQTSSIVPLCHPININKVEVDVKLRPPSGGRYSSGSVLIIAQVECNGSTGVEMEALTAATASALTVYDMCKAVDRAMTILHASVLYKSGGRSGIIVNNGGIAEINRGFFLRRGLEMPADK